MSFPLILDLPNYFLSQGLLLQNRLRRYNKELQHQMLKQGLKMLMTIGQLIDIY